MKLLFKVLLILVFSTYAPRLIAQTDSIQVISRDAKSKKISNTTEGKTAGQVKQVRSARPDMSKSRGARPPDIVRPSGSRIPRGVGKPAGAVIHGRG